jgi:hypothetical protein
MLNLIDEVTHECLAIRVLESRQPAACELTNASAASVNIATFLTGAGFRSPFSFAGQ